MKHLGLILLLIVNPLWAQSDFNPDDPAEPSTPVFYYALTAVCDPDGAGTTSGKGNYAPGQTVTVRTSARAGYTFQYWTLNGEQYSTDMSFNYETVEGAMDFVAHYLLTPDDPAEPFMDVKSRLYLESQPEGICTFNLTSGGFVTADQPLTVSVTGADQWYEFRGWYKGDTKISDAATFLYTPDYEDATLVAHFEEVAFNPTDPDEPDQEPVEGDVNCNKRLSIADLAAFIEVARGNDNTSPHQYDHDRADMNQSGGVTLTDLDLLVNLLLGR